MYATRIVTRHNLTRFCRKYSCQSFLPTCFDCLKLKWCTQQKIMNEFLPLFITFRDIVFKNMFQFFFEAKCNKPFERVVILLKSYRFKVQHINNPSISSYISRRNRKCTVELIDNFFLSSFERSARSGYQIKRPTLLHL